VTDPSPSPASPLAERLGQRPGGPVLVVTADDLGTSQAATAGCFDALRRGLASSGGLSVPCPWARAAAGGYRGEDVGVHLVVNAELDAVRWGPITHAPSLLDGDGGFPRTVEDLWDHADVDEVRREVRAQLERAVLWGFDVTHLSVHLDALLLRPEFFDVVLELAVGERLPLRLPPDHTLDLVGFPLRQLCADARVVAPDRVLRSRPGRPARVLLERFLLEPPPGITELVVRPAIDTPELRAMEPGWAERVDDHDLVTTDAAVAGLLARAKVVVTGYRALREAMRA